MNIIDVIRKAIEADDCTVDGIIAASNYCICEILNDPDYELYEFDSFCEMLDECAIPASDIIAKTRYGDLDFSKDYFGFDGYGNFRSLYYQEAIGEALDNIENALDNSDEYTDFDELIAILEIDVKSYWCEDDDEDDDEDEDEDDEDEDDEDEDDEDETESD